METASVSDCKSKHRADATSQSGYLASYTSSGSVGIGTPSCPWYIRVPRGQRLNLTLFNFISPMVALPGQSAAKLVETCYHVGVVRDGPDRRQSVVETCYYVGVVRDGPDQRQSVTACSNEPRQRTILVSSSNTVSFEFSVRGLHVRPSDHQAQFLIRYDGQKFVHF